MDLPNRHRRPDKVAKKYYFAPDVVELIETEAQRTGYPRNLVLELLVRTHLGRNVEEAFAVAPAPEPKPKPKPKRKPRRRIDIFEE